MGEAAGSLDIVSVGANAGVLIAFSVAALSGGFATWRRLKEKMETMLGDDPKERIAGAVIMENTTMMMLTEALRDNCESNRDLQREVAELRFEVRLARETRRH